MSRHGVLKSLRHFLQRIFNGAGVGLDQMQPGTLAQHADGLTPLTHHDGALGLQGFDLLINVGENGALRLRLPDRMGLRHGSYEAFFNAQSVARKTLGN